LLIHAIRWLLGFLQSVLLLHICGTKNLTMKRYFTFLFLLKMINFTVVNAQVAINTGNLPADPSAILDIKSDNKGLLIPRVYISSVVPHTSVPNAAAYMLVFNINSSFSKGEGLYYNAGTPAAINWKPVSDIIFPYYKGSSENNALFRLENYSMNAASSTIKTMSAAGTALYAETVSGYALQTRGKINIAGTAQAPAQGKVLTSDANGNATWEGGVAFLASGIQAGGASEIKPYYGKKTPYLSEVYDYGNNFNPSNISPHSTFTAPVKGIYHFDAGICFKWDVSGIRTSIAIVRVRSGVELKLSEQEIEKTAGWIDNRISLDCELIPGDQICIEANCSGLSNQFLDTQHTKNFFSGRLVMRLQ
jgi:hypothetical protein